MDCARAVSFKMSTSHRTPTPVRNESKFIDLMMRIELTGAVLLSRLSDSTPFSHVFIFGNMFNESHGFVAVQVTSSKNFVSLHYN